jgi:hypothetical protein
MFSTVLILFTPAQQAKRQFFQIRTALFRIYQTISARPVNTRLLVDALGC